jgi:rod shape-determining protein MreC
VAIQAHPARRRYVLVLIVLSALTLATLDKRSSDSGPIGAVGRVAHRVVQPFANAADVVFSPLHDWWDGVVHSGHLKSENRDLRRQVAALRARVNESDQALLQLQYYEEFFGKNHLDDYKNVGASVVTGTIGNVGSTVTIDRGTEAGIIPGMAVVLPDGLAGAVDKAWHGGAQVLLVTDASFGVAIRINRTFGTARTESDGTMRVDFSVNTRSRVRPKRGDVAFTCGCNQSDFPPGIPVGTVTRVVQNGPDLVVRVQPYVDVGSLDVVKVILWTSGDPVPVPAVPPSTTTAPAPTTTTTNPSSSSSSSSSSSPTSSPTSSSAPSPTSSGGG